VLAAAGLASNASVGQAEPKPAVDTAASALEETRMAMGKWIETQQLISKERNDWQQGKGILAGRVELLQKEITTLQEKIAEAESSVAECDRKRTDLLAENARLEAVGKQLTAAVSKMEGDVRRMFQALPAPVLEKLRPLIQRMPEDQDHTRVSVAERFQNVLGILNELNKTNHEITVSYEVRNLDGGRPTEVKTIYVGLAHAYYVSARGEAGVGRPTAEGWQWQPTNAVAKEVLTALEIQQGKQTPAFVPLPVKLDE
jgi:hypothetical protein